MKLREEEEELKWNSREKRKWDEEILLVEKIKQMIYLYTFRTLLGFMYDLKFEVNIELNVDFN